MADDLKDYPLGSNAFPVFDKNVQNLDRAINDRSSTQWTDRFDQHRMTWHGIERDAQVQIDRAEDAADRAVAAASASGVFEFSLTYSDAEELLPLPDGTIIEVAQDETHDGSRTRYIVEDGALEFAANLDQLRVDLASDAPGKGAEIVSFVQAGSGAADRTSLDKLRERISLRDFDGLTTDPSQSNHDVFLKAFQVASSRKGTLVMSGGPFPLKQKVAFTGDLDIVVEGYFEAVCTSEDVIASLFEITGNLNWRGGKTVIDAAEKCYLGIHAPLNLPKLENIHYKNTLSVASLHGANFNPANGANGYTGNTGVGQGYMRDCSTENCGTFTISRGSVADPESSFGLVDCKTDALSGFVTNIFNLGSLGYGYTRGGWYQAVPTTSPNMTRTKRCEYLGGVYEGTTRGPTVGEDVEKVIISGGITINPSYSGVSVDARRGDRVVPYVDGIVDWTVRGEPDYGVFVQASGLHVARLTHIGEGVGTSSQNVVRLSDSLDVQIGAITGRNQGSRVLINVGQADAPVPGSTAIKTGDWVSDSNLGSGEVRCSPLSKLTYAPVRTVSASTVLNPFEDVILVEANTALVDIDVPNATSVFTDVVGKRWRVVVVDGTFRVTITRQGGGATAINGTNLFDIPIGPAYRSVDILSVGGGNYVVTPNY